MIKFNITLTIAIIIGFTCTQQMDAAQRRHRTGSNELPVHSQALSPYDQARITELQHSINEQTGQWYQEVVCTIPSPCDGYQCTRAGCNKAMAVVSPFIPAGIGTTAAILKSNPHFALTLFPAALCLAGCMCLYDTEHVARNNAQALGQWYNAPLIKCCGRTCDRTDVHLITNVGYMLIPLGTGIATNIPAMMACCTAASSLCIYKCTRYNDPGTVAKELAKLLCLHTH